MRLPDKKHVKFCYQLICFAFMSINCIFISKWYFEYRVTIKAGPSVPFDMYFPQLSLCFSLSSLLSPEGSDFFSTKTSSFLNKKISALKNSILPQMISSKSVFTANGKPIQSSSRVHPSVLQCVSLRDAELHVLQIDTEADALLILRRHPYTRTEKTAVRCHHQSTPERWAQVVSHVALSIGAVRRLLVQSRNFAVAH